MTFYLLLGLYAVTFFFFSSFFARLFDIADDGFGALFSGLLWPVTFGVIAILMVAFVIRQAGEQAGGYLVRKCDL